MIVSLKDGFKLIGISIMACCAVCVCNMFLNFQIDLRSIANQVEAGPAQALYDAFVNTSIVCCACCGGCMLITSVVMLFFYIKHYIDSHSREIGILKAHGYSNFRISRGFAIFAISIFVGCLAGYLLSFAIMPMFYQKQNDNDLLPHIPMNIHWIMIVLLIVVPTIVFAFIAIGYSVIKLNQPTINLLKGITKQKGKYTDGKDKKNFISEMRSSILKSRKTLVFFIILSSFCFSSMIQMSASMDELASEMMGIMILIIGIVLAFTTFYIALTTVLHANQKNIAMMRVFGYSAFECKRSVLDCYRIPAYIGFAIGTGYQFGLLKMMVTIVFKDVEGVPDYSFDWPMFFITLGAFIVIYEGVMFLYGYLMKKIPLKQIMDE